MERHDSLGFQILRAIRRIIRRTSEHSRSVGKHGGVSVPQMLCLKSISEFPEGTEITVAMVAKAVQLSAPTVSRILDKMERNGYVARERNSKDRRAGLRIAHRNRVASDRKPANSAARAVLERLDRLDPIECLGLLKALERIVELMDAEGIDAAPLLTPELDVGPNGTPSDDRDGD